MPALAWGDYTFEENSVYFTIDRTSRLSKVGRRMFIDHLWTIHGRVGTDGDTPATIDTKKSLLETVCADGDGRDLVFSLGTYNLVSSQCVSGTHVMKFRWLTGYDGAHGSGAEAILRRTFFLQIGGSIPWASDTNIISHHESIRGIGTGGPHTKPVRSLSGLVQPQQVEAVTEFWAIQSGNSVGLTTMPAANDPIWQATPGVFYVPEKFIITPGTPINFGPNINTGFPISWSYTCWSNSQLVAAPTGF